LRNDFDEAINASLREDLARHLGLPVEVIKPCVANIGPQAEGRRSEFAHILAVELLRAGASPLKVAAYLGYWAERCEQPPKASHAFTLRDLESTLKSATKKQETEGLRGYGCRGPLAEFCPYGEADRLRCPYISRNRRPLRRDKITTLLGAFNLAKAHRAPADWKPSVVFRRRFLHMAIGALEAAKGYAGGELITSLQELEYQTGISRSTLRRDLEAMAAAGWLSFTPGLSRREKGELPARGAALRRLLPGEAEQARKVSPSVALRTGLAAILEAFGAEVTCEARSAAFCPLISGGNP